MYSFLCSDSIIPHLKLFVNRKFEKYLIDALSRRVFAENPAAFDPREYLKVARAEVKKMVSHKIVNVLGSKGTL